MRHVGRRTALQSRPSSKRTALENLPTTKMSFAFALVHDPGVFCVNGGGMLSRPLAERVLSLGLTGPRKHATQQRLHKRSLDPALAKRPCCAPLAHGG